MEYSDKVVNMHWSSLFHNVFLNNIVKMFLLRQPNENIKFVSPFQIIQRARTDTWCPFNQRGGGDGKAEWERKEHSATRASRLKDWTQLLHCKREAFLFPEGKSKQGGSTARIDCDNVMEKWFVLVRIFRIFQIFQMKRRKKMPASLEWQWKGSHSY